jgi:antitoxin VapB
MAVLIKDAETDRLVRELAARTGETLTEAVRNAAAARLRTISVRPGVDLAKVDALLAEIHAMPVEDHRSADEIIGYDENGLPT